MRYLDIGIAKEISKIGRGTWQVGSREWGYGDQYADQVARAIVRRAVELDITLFDTAEIYGFGRSEKILGQALGEDRERVFLATKILPVLPVAPVEASPQNHADSIAALAAAEIMVHIGRREVSIVRAPETRTVGADVA